MFGLFGKSKKAARPKTKEEVIAEAQANARKARATLGQENIEKLAAQLADKNPFEDLVPEAKTQKTAAEEARELLQNMDSGHVADHLRMIIEEDKYR